MVFREEHDFDGSVSVPEDVHYGIATSRMLSSISDEVSSHHWLADSMVMIKKSSLPSGKLAKACDDFLAGRLDESVISDVFISPDNIHGHINEVLANRALDHSHAKKGDYHVVHPDHFRLSHDSQRLLSVSVRVSLARLSLELFHSLRKIKRGVKDSCDSVLSSNADKSIADQLVSCLSGLEESERLVKRSVEKMKQLPVFPSFSEQSIKSLKGNTSINFRKGSAGVEDFSQLSSALRLLSSEMLKLASVMSSASKDTSAILPFCRIIANDHLILQLQHLSVPSDYAVSMSALHSMEDAINGLLRFEQDMKPASRNKERSFASAVSPYLTHSFSMRLSRHARDSGKPMRQVLLSEKVMTPKELGSMFSSKFSPGLAKRIRLRPAYRRLDRKMK